VPSRTYGQYCGFARALEVVGERWALLVVRDLLVGPKRFSDLQRGLPGIPSNILTARLKELEESGIVVRRVLPRPSGAIVYELTAAGRELEGPVISLGRWGAKRMGDPRPDEIVTPDSIASALKATFRPENAGRDNVKFELHVGDIVASAHVQNGSVHVTTAPIEKPDLVIHAGPGIRQIMAREVRPDQAVKKKMVKVEGDRKLFARFTQLFQI
jgi:DNA-binding HxlR family transcriptional regulator